MTLAGYKQTNMMFVKGPSLFLHRCPGYRTGWKEARVGRPWDPSLDKGRGPLEVTGRERKGVSEGKSDGGEEDAGPKTPLHRSQVPERPGGPITLYPHKIKVGIPGTDGSTEGPRGGGARAATWDGPGPGPVGE